MMKKQFSFTTAETTPLTQVTGSPEQPGKCTSYWFIATPGGDQLTRLLAAVQLPFERVLGTRDGESVADQSRTSPTTSGRHMYLAFGLLSACSIGLHVMKMNPDIQTQNELAVQVLKWQQAQVQHHQAALTLHAQAHNETKQGQDLETQAQHWLAVSQADLANASVMAIKAAEQVHIFLQDRDFAESQEALAAQDEEELQKELEQAKAFHDQAQEEMDKYDSLLVCRVKWTRWFCAWMGGPTEVAKARQLNIMETQEFQRAMHLQTERLDELKAQVAALSDAKHHLERADGYHLKHLELEKRAHEENELAKEDWTLGQVLLAKASWDEKNATEDENLAENDLGHRNELLSALAKISHKISREARWVVFLSFAALLCFTVSLLMGVTSIGTYVSTLHSRWMELSMPSLRCLEELCLDTSWTGRTISVDNLDQDRHAWHELLRKSSLWFHHVLIFLFVTGWLGHMLISIFTVELLLVRGDILLRFAILAGIVESLLFQLIPHASTVRSWDGTLEVVQNFVKRLVASTCYFYVEMLLILILFGEGSTCLRITMESLATGWRWWTWLLLTCAMAHMWFLEFPYSCRAVAGNDTIVSALTVPTTVDTESQARTKNSPTAVMARLFDDEDDDDEEEKDGTVFASRESDSLLAARCAEYGGAESVGSSLSLPYSSIGLNSNDSDLPMAQPISNESAASTSGPFSLYRVSLKEEMPASLVLVELILLASICIVVCTSMPWLEHRAF